MIDLEFAYFLTIFQNITTLGLRREFLDLKQRFSNIFIETIYL